MKVGQDVTDKPFRNILVRLLCQMNSIPDDAFIWIWTNWYIWISTPFYKCIVIITSSTTASFLQIFSIKSYTLGAIQKKKFSIRFILLLISLKFIRSRESLTKKWSITVNRLESIVIITICYSNFRIFFSQSFKGLFELIIVIYCEIVQSLQAMKFVISCRMVGL